MSSRDAHSNPFGVLGLEANFDLDLRALKTAWMRSAALQHPDAAGSLRASTCVNDAYRVLLDPVLRAEALLRLWDAPAVDGRRLPDGFLSAMMELRERADEARGDAAALAELRTSAEDRRKSALAIMSQAFGRGGTAGISIEAAQEIQMQINVLRSFERMLEQLDREADGR